GVVVVYSRSHGEAESTARDIEAAGGQALLVQADVTDDAKCRSMVTTCVDEFGRVDVLVNCAGTTKFIPFNDLEAVSDQTWQWLYQVNVVGAFHCARAVREAMLASGGGQIINVSSVAAQLSQGSSIPYCCSKAALDSLSVSLARTLAPRIRVNSIAPGFITGRWTQEGLGDRYESVKQGYERTVPLQRVCESSDVADAIISLITGSTMITGQTLTVDGGMMITGFHPR
ncbi:MAG: SDR family oxidoreductase, partial [Planctomycetes bacterium]|nr:SDR family oxidoreductase [Planctomycetota bacterium]